MPEKRAQREILATITKADSSIESAGTFVLSDESVDRQGDVISADGWELTNFRRNPIALWQHNAEKPIGTWGDVRVDGHRLLGDLCTGATKLGEMARQLVDEGTLRAVSVGFRVLEHTAMDEKEPWGAWNILKAELLEVSLVSIPANPSALILSKSLGLSQADRSLVFSASLPEIINSSTSPRIHPSIKAARVATEAARQTLRQKS